MSTSNINITDSLRDGNDCLLEGIKAFRRLKKISPVDTTLIDQAMSHVSSARDLVSQLEQEIIRRSKE